MIESNNRSHSSCERAMNGRSQHAVSLGRLGLFTADRHGLTDSRMMRLLSGAAKQAHISPNAKQRPSTRPAGPSPIWDRFGPSCPSAGAAGSTCRPTELWTAIGSRVPSEIPGRVRDMPVRHRSEPGARGRAAPRSAGDPGNEAALHLVHLQLAGICWIVIVVGLRPGRNHGVIKMQWTIPSSMTPRPRFLQRKAAGPKRQRIAGPLTEVLL